MVSRIERKTATSCPSSVTQHNSDRPAFFPEVFVPSNYEDYPLNVIDQVKYYLMNRFNAL